MSVICSKEYTVTIAPAPAASLVAYWNLDQAASPMTDSLGHYNLSVFSGAIISVAGKIGNCLDLYTGRCQTGATSGAFKFLNHDFSLRYWFKPDYAGGFVGDGLSSIAVNDADFGDWSWEIVYSEDNSHLGPAWKVWDTLNTEFDINANVALTNAWHHVYCWVHNGVEIGMRIDDGATYNATTPFTNIYNTPGDKLRTNRTASGGGDPHNLIDEIAVWNRLLTPAEITADYNGGTGKTYPNVPL